MKQEIKLTIDEARKIINQQDEIILHAFEKRMEAASQIAANKINQGLPIYVPEREKEILDRIAGQVNEELSQYAVQLYEKLMEVSRAYQNSGRHFGLLGRKLGHSFSPEIHKMIGDKTEPYNYGIYQVEPEALEDFVCNGEWTGLNVTIPYKKDVMKYCDEIAPEASRIGAVNTLVRRNGKIYGYNTDYFGFRKTIESTGVAVAGTKCIVLGSGGASATAVTVLKDLKAREVIVVSRDGKTGCDYEGLLNHKDAEILINTTPMGMYPETGVSPVDVSIFDNLKLTFDVVYNPLRTELLCQSAMAGVKSVNGLKMLVAQAKASAEYFLGREIGDDILAGIENHLKEEKENIVLIGMPGCGKSTIGRALAVKLGKEFIDIDEKIVEKTGMAIPDIFQQSGEEGFRKIETEVTREVGKMKGAVIACGGGVVTRNENYSPLAENGRFIFINRNIDVLPIDGRPLSQSTPLQQMYEKRLPMYRLWCDEEIVNEGKTIMEIVEELCR